jgi:two-component system chemotaxis response regulator CheB
MPVRVLIVDDSGFFRHRISDLLSGDSRIEVVGTAQNGKEAVEQAKKLRPSLITMDVEMPQMNGIEAVGIIMRECPTNILMLSSLTSEGARVTLQALEAGALDYLPKDMRAWMAHSGSLEKQLRDKVVALGRSTHARLRGTFTDQSSLAQANKSRVFSAEALSTSKATSTASTPASTPGRVSSTDPQRLPATGGLRKPSERSLSNIKIPDCKVVVIGASTGGPAALQQILTQIPANFPHPILLVQHMPKAFTTVFAARLNQQCNIEVKEAEDGDKLIPGRALLAPGGHQMIIDPRSTDKIRIMPGDERLTYKPSVDVTYASVAKSFGKKVLAVILTGMGADGCDGAGILRQQGATIWAQNQDSCTIYGMPKAIINAGLADAVLDLNELTSIFSGKRP